MEPGADPFFMFDERRQVVGVCLSHNFASEHERGIAGIRDQFGIDKELPGILSKKISKVSPLLHWVDWNDGTSGFYIALRFETVSPAKVPTDLMCFRHEPTLDGGQIAAAWDDRRFGIRVTRPLRELLRTLFDSFSSNDICIMISNNTSVFGGFGLLITRASSLSERVDNHIRKSQKKIKDTKSYEDETGIKERLRAAGISFGYLSVVNTTGPTPVWWLNGGKNPNRSYHEDLYGGFTLEELEQQARGEGPLAAYPEGVSR